MAADFVQVRTEQLSNAALELGLTNVSRGKGQENRLFPNLTGAFAVKVVDYWSHEADRVQGHVAKIPDSAIRSAWMRQVNIMKGLRGQVADAEPHKLLPPPVAILVWTSVDGIALPLRGLTETPTKWDLIKESVVESVQEFGFGTKQILALLAVALVALVSLKWSR